ncbi:amidase [Agaricicola taiwanensis]|uniref:Amidase n=1 Tax=Agaricicola taiwanensis TaxID=591372 RepID=A0A8J2VXL9_9RHOB|nr:amidase [Agaricicola taiwanensis]GGE41778.1 amidase [Agaricicola taiwanensis]
MRSPLGLTLCAATDAIAAGDLTCEDLVTASLDALDGIGVTLNAVVATERDEAFSRARALDRVPRESRGRLHGVPLAHKDMYYRAGHISGCGSKIRAGFTPDTTSPLVAALERAGSVTVARLHMAEFAMGPTGHNTHLGRCRNPWDPEKITGGSSSGSGAAVAARTVFASLGSDTGGSVRLPAAMCGVVGLKPTQGLLSTDHMMGLSESLDCPGPLARSSRDVARLIDVMAALDCEAGLAGDARGLAVGIARGFYWEDLDPQVETVMTEAARVFKDLGAEVFDVDIPDQTALADLADAVWTPEAAALHLDWLRERMEDYGPQLRARLAQGLAVSAVGYSRARALRALALRAMVEGPLARCDVLLAPAMRHPTPTGAATDHGGGPAMREALARLSALTRPISFLGLPALSTPAGFDAEGCPISLQLIGHPRGEARMLRLSDAFERATGHLDRKPKYSA